MQNVFIFILTVNALYMYIFKTYLGVIRHSTFVDLFKIFLANLCGVLTIVIINYSYFLGSNEKVVLIPFLGLYFAISCLFLFIIVKSDALDLPFAGRDAHMTPLMGLIAIQPFVNPVITFICTKIH